MNKNRQHEKSVSWKIVIDLHCKRFNKKSCSQASWATNMVLCDALFALHIRSVIFLKCSVTLFQSMWLDMIVFLAVWCFYMHNFLQKRVRPCCQFPVIVAYGTFLVLVTILKTIWNIESISDRGPFYYVPIAKTAWGFGRGYVITSA